MSKIQLTNSGGDLTLEVKYMPQTTGSCEGFKLLRVNRRWSVAAPNGKSFPLKKGHVLQRIFNMFEEATPADKDIWGADDAKIKFALEINYEAIRQLFLDKYWA